jgi:hypothetical protein
MSSSNPTAIPTEFHPYGLPMGTVRGFLSVLICLFFWIALLYPGDQTPPLPLAHFFLLSLVFLAFASHPIHDAQTSSFLPWLMRVIFVGGSGVVVAYVAYKTPAQLGARLTPNAADIYQWPVLLGCFAGGFGIALFVRFIMGRKNELFQTLRAWLGVLAILLLIFETLFQFVIIPELSDRPAADALKVWEGTLVACVAAYFGCRA